MLMQINLHKKFWQWATLLLLALVWGSSFILMKRGLESFSNQQVAAYRIVVSFLMLLPIAWRHIKQLKGKYLYPLLAVGLLGNCFPAFLFTKAQTGLDSSFAGMLNALVPLFALLIGTFFFRMKMHRMQGIGVAIGLLGAAGLFLANGIAGLEINLGYGIYIIIATVFYGITLNVIKKHLHDLNATALTSLAFLLIGPPTCIYLFMSGFFSSLKMHDTSMMTNLMYVTILGIFGTGLAVILFNKLIKHTTTLFAASVTYLVPIVAIFWGILDGEALTVYHFLWMSVIIIGVYLINRQTVD